MSDFKGTPGPWHYIGTTLGEDSGWFVRVAPHRHVSAEGRNGKEAEANARLIAAAPDLLEACQTFAEWLRREDEGLPSGIERDTPEGERKWRIWWDENLRICNLAQQQVRAAIAKATGEQP